jgi:hypothetical protein
MKSLRGTLDKNSLQSTEMNCVLNSKRVYKFTGLNAFQIAARKIAV